MLQCVGLLLVILQMTGVVDRQHPDFRKVPSKDIVASVLSYWHDHCDQQMISVEASNHLVGMILAHANVLIRTVDADNPFEQEDFEKNHSVDQYTLRLRMQAQAPSDKWFLIWAPEQNWLQFRVWGSWVEPVNLGVNRCDFPSEVN